MTHSRRVGCVPCESHLHEAVTLERWGMKTGADQPTVPSLQIRKSLRIPRRRGCGRSLGCWPAVHGPRPLGQDAAAHTLQAGAQGERPQPGQSDGTHSQATVRRPGVHGQVQDDALAKQQLALKFLSKVKVAHPSPQFKLSIVMTISSRTHRPRQQTPTGNL